MTQSALTREIATPIPTLSIAEVQFEASWDGAECIVIGPEEVPVGIYEFIFRDSSDQNQDLWMSHIREGHDYQDVLAYGKPGEWVPQPSWAVSPLMMREWDDDLDAEIVTISLEWPGEYSIHLMNDVAGWPCRPLMVVEESSDKPGSPTLNPMQAAMTEQAPGDMANPLPTWTPWPTPSTQIEVTWNGTECVVTGPSEVPVGYNEFIWRDLRDHGYGLAVRYLHDGYSYQDLLDLQDEPGEFIPSRASWVEEIEGRYRRDDSLDAEVYTYHFDQEGNYSFHFWDTNFLWICGGLTAVDSTTE